METIYINLRLISIDFLFWNTWESVLGFVVLSATGPLFLFTRLQLAQILSILSIEPFPKQALVFFTCLQYKSFENTVGKGEIARNKQFLLFHSVSCLFEEFSAVFITFEIENLQTLSVWKSLKFVVWERNKE